MINPVKSALAARLESISKWLMATVRETPPGVQDAELWIESIDEITSKTTWLRRDLLTEATALRLRLWGAG